MWCKHIYTWGGFRNEVETQYIFEIILSSWIIVFMKQRVLLFLEQKYFWILKV